MKESDFNSVKFNMRISDDNSPVDLTGADVRIAVKKPSGLTVFQDCTIIDAETGTCEVILTNQAYIEVGSHTAEIVITKGEMVTITKSFEFSSLNAIFDDDSLESQNDWQAIHDIMLEHDLRPILGENAPNGVVTPEYIGQTYLDTIGMVMYFASSESNDGWLPFGTGGGTGGTGTVYWNDVLLKPSTFTPSAHTHLWEDITDVPAQFTPIAHQHDWSTGITNKPDAYPPEEHSHDEYISEDEADQKYQAKDTVATHTHVWADITDKPTTFTPPLATTAAVGGMMVGNGLRMTGNFLTVRDGLGIKTNTTTSELDINKTLIDTWYVRTTQNLAMWTGTQTEYEALGTYDSATLYFITG